MFETHTMPNAPVLLLFVPFQHRTQRTPQSVPATMMRSHAVVVGSLHASFNVSSRVSDEGKQQEVGRHSGAMASASETNTHARVLHMLGAHATACPVCGVWILGPRDTRCVEAGYTAKECAARKAYNIDKKVLLRQAILAPFQLRRVSPDAYEAYVTANTAPDGCTLTNIMGYEGRVIALQFTTTTGARLSMWVCPRVASCTLPKVTPEALRNHVDRLLPAVVANQKWTLKPGAVWDADVVPILRVCIAFLDGQFRARAAAHPIPNASMPAFGDAAGFVDLGKNTWFPLVPDLSSARVWWHGCGAATTPLECVAEGPVYPFAILHLVYLLHVIDRMDASKVAADRDAVNAHRAVERAHFAALQRATCTAKRRAGASVKETRQGCHGRTKRQRRASD